MSEIKNLQQIATEIVDPNTGKPKIFCDFCCVTFSRMGALYTHLRKFHDLPVTGKANLLCGLCDKKFRTMPLLQEHIQNEHSISLKFVDETFYSQKEFLDWKAKIEKESLSSFIVRNSTSQKDKGVTNTYYLCHRSGQSKYKQDRVRNKKAVGSIKSGSTCPAIMKVSTETIDGISEIKVNYQSVHVGHDLEMRSIRLTREERENFASCLRLGMTIDKILEQAKQNPSPTNRFSFLTRKHLLNICRDFGIKSNVPKPNKKQAPQDIAEASDCSNNCADYLEVEISNFEEIQESEQIHENVRIEESEQIHESVRIEESEKIQELETNTAVSSLLLLQNQNYSEEFKNRKVQIVNQLKALELRIDEWESACPLPEVEEYIRAVNAMLDISASSYPNFQLDGTPPVLSETSTNKPAKKRRKIAKDSKKD